MNGAPPTNDHEKIKELLRIKDEAPFAFDRLKSALIIVDVQRRFTRPEYPMWRVVEKLVSGASAGYFERVQSTILGNTNAFNKLFDLAARQ